MLKNLDSASQQSLITSKRRILALQALGIGLAAGLLAVGFRLSLESAEATRSALIAFAVSRGGAYLALPSLVFGLLTTGVVYLTVRYSPDASGSGIPHLKGYLSGDTTFRAVAVGTAVAGCPPHRSVREGFPHTALASGRTRSPSRE